MPGSGSPDAGEVVTLYLDKFSFYRWPTPPPDYFPIGCRQPLARLVPGYDTRSRVISALDVVEGRVLYLPRARITVRVLVSFMGLIRVVFPQAHLIFLIQDNWHQVHFHPDQIQAATRLGIELVPLPTYAPWLNLIEKLERKMRQEVEHMHRQSGEWDTSKARVDAFFTQFTQGSPEWLSTSGYYLIKSPKIISTVMQPHTTQCVIPHSDIVGSGRYRVLVPGTLDRTSRHHPD